MEAGQPLQMSRALPDWSRSDVGQGWTEVPATHTWCLDEGRPLTFMNPVVNFEPITAVDTWKWRVLFRILIFINPPSPFKHTYGNVPARVHPHSCLIWRVNLDTWFTSILAYRPVICINPLSGSVIRFRYRNNILKTKCHILTSVTFRNLLGTICLNFIQDSFN